MKDNKKGFTLAELLIVVAIIAVLVAIAIPIFASQLEKAREATDVANARDYYAEISVALVDGTLNSTDNTMSVSGGLTATATYNSTTKVLESVAVAGTTVNQREFSKWQSGTPVIGGVTVADAKAPTAASDSKITYTFATDAQGHTYLNDVAWGA